ncbi:hypothetical protein Glove_117g615 [Diversispora epigaea]|uniref:Uncharacterized protein n=1 Tax=Diversispora epigaea TaxID=1348612 RepID=A0A397J0F3_9GLOM|nr:hypothetical protein Glove_117g615 [Diversispora epigaea]
MNCQFNLWLTNQKYRHQIKNWFEGPDKNCWCQKHLHTGSNQYADCYNEYSRWETIQIISIQEIRNAQSLLVSGGVEELVQNEYNFIVQDILEKYSQVVAIHYICRQNY